MTNDQWDGWIKQKQRTKTKQESNMESTNCELSIHNDMLMISINTSWPMTSGMVELNKNKEQKQNKKVTWKVQIVSYQFTMHFSFCIVTDQILFFRQVNVRKKGIQV